MEDYTSRLVVIWLAGVLGGAVISTGLHSVSGPTVSETKVFQREEGKPAVMRLYRKYAADGLLVENLRSEEHKTFLKEKGYDVNSFQPRYIPLDEYLDRIPDKADRNVEEILVKKAAEWYKE